MNLPGLVSIKQIEKNMQKKKALCRLQGGHIFEDKNPKYAWKRCICGATRFKGEMIK